MKKNLIKVLAAFFACATLALGFSACKEEHAHSYTETITAPTCTEQGYTTYSCSCGDSYFGDYVDALDHDFKDYIYNNDAKCEQDGTETAICNNGCGKDDTRTKTGTAFSHVYGDWVSIGNGQHKKTCANDNSHTITESCSGGTATCTEKAVCKDCNVAYGNVVKHTYNQKVAENKYLQTRATCDSKAVYFYSCSCGDKGTITFEYGSALGHSYDNWVSIGNGQHKKTCANDNSHTITESCSGGTASCTEKAVCAYCKTVYGDFLEHSYDDTGYCVCGDKDENYYTQGITFMAVAGGYTVGWYNGSSTTLVIPDYYNGEKVVAISKTALNNCQSLKKIIIGNNVETIPEGVFRDCTSLQELTIPFIDDIFGKLFGEGSYFSYNSDSFIPDKVTGKKCSLGHLHQIPTSDAKWCDSSISQWVETSNGTALWQGEWVSPYSKGLWECKVNGVTCYTYYAASSLKLPVYYIPKTLRKVTISNQQISTFSDEYETYFKNVDFSVAVLKKYPVSATEIIGASEVFYGEFDYSDYKIKTTRSDGLVESTYLRKEYLSEADQLKLNTVGNHSITVNYDGRSINWNITIKPLEFSGLGFVDKTFTYDGQTKSLVVTGLPVGAKVNYSNNNKIDAGTYTVTATISLENYRTTTLTATLKIEQRELNVKFSGATSIKYDGNVHKEIIVSATNIVAGDSVSLSISYSGAMIEAGDYVATAVLAAHKNYKLTENNTYKISITRETHTVTFKQAGQPDKIKTVLDLADLTDIPSVTPVTGHTVVWEEKNLAKITSNITVNAIITINQYTISFITGNEQTLGSITQEYNTSLTLPEPTWVERSFIGWFNKNLTTQFTKTKMPAENVVLYAKWLPNEYSISYNLDGGSVANKTIYNIETPTFTLNHPTKTGYTFIGWTGANGDVPELNVSVELGTVGDLEFIANWSINQYTITLVFNNGNDNDEIEFDYQEDIVIENPTWNRKSFVGWYEDEDLTIAHSYTKMPNKHYTLYAKWETYDITIFYDETKTAVSANDVISAELFGATAIDTDETVLDVNVEILAGQLQVGETITIRLTAVGLFSVKKVQTITDIRVYGTPALTCDNTKGYINMSDELVGDLFSAIGTDTFGNATDIVVTAKEGEYKAGDIVTIVVTAIDVAGNEFAIEIPNVKVYGTPIINRDETIVDMKVSEIVSNEKFVVTATDSFGVSLDVATEIINGTFAKGQTITVRSSATDSKGNVGYVDYKIKVYGLPTISNASTKDFKVEDEITLETLGVVVKDSFGFEIENVTLTLQNGTQEAGAVLTYLVVATDHLGNERTLVIDNVRIFGAPEITCTTNKKSIENLGKKIVPVTVSFDLNGAIGYIDAQTITDTQELIYPSIPARSGYAFAGWYDNIDCIGTPFDFSANLDSDIILYAKWIRPSYSYKRILSVGDNTGYVSYNHETQYYPFVSLVDQTITIYTEHWDGDPYIFLLDYNKNQLASNDDSYGNLDAIITYNVTAGTLYYAAFREVGAAIQGTGCMYISGRAIPPAGGFSSKSVKALAGCLDCSAKDSFGNDLSIDIDMISGELIGGEIVYCIITAVDLVGNKTVINVPVRIYDKNDIVIDYNKYASDLIKLSSCGEEFLATATDSFGEPITLQVVAVDGELTAGTIESIKLVAIDGAGNVKESEIIENIKVYGLPTITYKYDGDYIDVSDNPDVLFDARDSFGEEAPFDIEVVEGEKILGQKITYKVTATDYYSGNVIEEIYVLDVVEKGKVGITLDVNGGNSIENSFILVLQNESFELEIPTRIGYKFIGWSLEGVFYTDENGNSVKSFDETFNIATMTANWEVVTYTITYELDGGTTSNTAEYTIESETIVLSNPTKAHCAFVEWQLDGEKITEIEKGSYGNKTIVAVWSPIVYTIVYELNGGNETINPVEYTIESETIVLSNPTKAHYDFVEWQLDGEKITEIAQGSYGNKTIVAVWMPTVYTISYELNGGSVVNETTYTIESEDVILNNPTKTGYKFLGWSGTDIEGMSTNVFISSGSTGNREYTANWEAITYTITYELNGGSATNENTYTIENERVELNNPTKTGYTFLGWSGTDIVGMSTNVVIPSGSTGNKTYTANWEVSTYTITYQLKGGTNNSNNVEQYTIESETIVLLEPVKEHCTFVEWQLDGEKITEIAKGSYGNKTLVAIWDAEIYTIAYKLNGGVNNSSNVAEYTVESETITLLNPTKAHYDFIEWQLNGKKITEIVSGSYGDIEVEAIFTPTVYTIACELKGGSVVNETTYTIESEDVILNNPTKTGYKFLGWSGTDIEGMSTNVVISIGSTGNREYTANWEVTVYNITYELNGGSATNENTYTIESENIVLNNPTKTGYTFLGWSGPDIVGISTNVVIPSGSIGNRTYTANWQVKTYTITYELDGGITTNVTTYTIESETIVLSNPTKAHYDFVEWQLNGKKITEIAKGSYGDKILVAIWDAEIYTITYKLNGGVNNGSNVAEYTVESETITLLNPTKAHYDFVEWRLNGEKVTQIVSGSYGDIELVAIWTPTVYTIKYVLGIDVENNNPTSYHIETSSFTLTTPTSKSYQFLGWYLDSFYTAQVTDIEVGTTGNITLYAKWTTIFTVLSYEKSTISGLTEYGKTLSEIVIPSTINGQEITTIKSFAFSQCMNLVNVELLNGISKIDNYAFSGCSSLTSITISNSVTSIGSNAFYYCNSLTKITIPSSVISMGDSIFFSCDSLIIYCEHETKPVGWNSEWNNVAYNKYAPVVWNCKDNEVAEDGFVHVIIENFQYKLKDGEAIVRGELSGNDTIIIPERVFYKDTEYIVTGIGDDAFNDRPELLRVEIPDTITNISDSIFYGCDSLIIYCEHASKPNGWVSYWNNSRPVVWNCNNNETATDGYMYVLLEDIVYALKNGEALLSTQARNITSLHILGNITYKGTVYNVTGMQTNALSHCNSLTKITVAPDSQIYKTIEGNLYSYDGKTLIKYVDDKDRTSFVVPDGVTTINEYAFYGSKSLVSVTIGDNVSTIGMYAFAWCDSLESIVVGKGITTIGDYAFEYCKNLVDIKFNATDCENFGSNNNVFAYAGTNSYGISVKFGTNVKNIPAYLFYPRSGKPEITEVIFENGSACENIGAFAFYNNYQLSNLELPANLISIGERAFYLCGGLKQVIIPVGVIEIGYGAFSHCSSLTIYCNVNEKPVGWNNNWNYSNCPVYWYSEKEPQKFNEDGTDYDKNYWHYNANGEMVNWVLTDYKITYQLSGGVNNEQNVYTYTKEETVVFYEPVRFGYDFIEWQLNGEKITGIPVGSLGNKTITAIWSPIDYTISYELNGGTNNPLNVNNYNIESNIELAIPTKEYYDFVEWQLDGKAITKIAKGSYGDKALVAVWTPTLYVITYELNGASVTNITEYTVESDNVALINPAKAGYIFLGWSGTDINGMSTNVVISSGSTGNRSYTANWEVIRYNISYELNGASVTNIAEYTVENEDITLINPVRAGYTFLGWSGTGINGMSTNVVIPSGSIGNRSYTANWEITNYQIVYEMNGGINNENNPISYTMFGDTIVLDTPKTREGYDFIGWQLDGEAVTEITGGSTGNKTIVAVWEAIYNVEGETIAGLTDYAKTNYAEFTVPEMIDGITITTIGKQAFTGSGKTKISLPNTITTIGESAFYNCSGLTEFIIPSTVTSIEKDAFGACRGLKVIIVPETVLAIGTNAFNIGNGVVYTASEANLVGWTNGWNGNSKVIYNYQKHSEENNGLQWVKTSHAMNGDAIYITGYSGTSEILDIPAAIDGANVVEIVRCAFANNTVLRNVVIPSSVIVIGERAFYYATALEEVVIGDSVQIIEMEAFFQCAKLKEISIPSSVKTIEDRAFAFCSTLSRLQFDSGLETIGFAAFAGCPGLTSISIPYTVNRIDAMAFAQCSNLTSISIMVGYPHYWWMADSVDATEGEKIESSALTTSATAAMYFTDTYVGKYWRRSSTI